MNNKVVALAIVATMVLAGLIITVPSLDVTWDTLKEKDPIAYERAIAVSSNQNVTLEDAANFTLYHCGLPDVLVGESQFDRLSMIDYSGITDGIKKDLSERANVNDLNRMLSNSSGLKKAYAEGTPYFCNGMALPLFEMSNLMDPEYKNENSSILRYCVYVETGYDTDDDGKRDLVKVLLQVPRTAMEGRYKAPVILECNPYGVGTLEESMYDVEPADSYDLSKLRSQPESRTVSSDIDSMDLAMSADVKDWMSEHSSYSSAAKYNYYLVRGFAVAICCGLGTYGSEGFVCTGTDIELFAYRSVIEWFDGKATAFSDKENCIRTTADWSNGNVGTVGQSYLGTMQIGLACLGIENMKAAIPVGAICNWYDYAVCQGSYINGYLTYISYLDGHCSSRYLVSGLSEQYKDYIAKLKYEETKLLGNYTDGTSDFWISRDYRNLNHEPGTAVLLIEGLNELNVRTKHTDNAYRMFSEAGYDVKAIFHLGLHQSLEAKMYPVPPSDKEWSTFLIDGERYSESINMWFSHYLFGIENGAEDFPNISIQNNLDGSWSYYDDLTPQASLTLTSESTNYNTISKASYDADPVLFKKESDAGRSTVLLDMDSDVTLFGVSTVKVRASTSNVIDNAVMTAAFYDLYDDGVTTYVNILPGKFVNQVRCTGDDMWVGGGVEPFNCVQYYESSRPYQYIVSAQVDMNNPSSDYDSRSAVFETIEKDTYYTYTIYMNPTVYIIEKGHTLAVSIYTFDPNNLDYENMKSGPYTLTLDEGSIEVTLSTI